MRCLLVNPWIADFAAYNFWVRPLGLYQVAQWLDSLGLEVCLLDCLSPFSAPGKFKRKPVPLANKIIPKKMDRSFARYGISREEFRCRLRKVGGFDVVFITSVMSYWYPGVQWVVEEIRRHNPGVPLILGGIYATLWPRHAQEHCGVDLVCSGPLERNKGVVTRFLGLDKRVQARPRPWYQIAGLWDGVNYGAVRTAIGCPFRCTYCASRIVSGCYRPRPVDEVIDEILFLYNKGVDQIAFYDDALLVDFPSRLGQILKGLARLGVSMAFHTPNGLHARLINREVATCLVRAGFSSVRLSLETVDPQRQRETGGKVTSRDLERAINFLLEAGMDPGRIGVYLLVGLPGQGLDEIEDGIRYVKSLGVRPYLAEFSPIPGTLEWERLEKKGVVSQGMDPLLTNNTVFYRLFCDYDPDRFQALKRLAAS